MRQGRLNEPERRLDVDLEEVVELGIGPVLEADEGSDAGVVDQDVEAPRPGDGFIHEGAGRVTIARLVTADAHIVAADEIRRHRSRLAHAEREPAAAPKEGARDRQADAAAGTRDP